MHNWPKYTCVKWALGWKIVNDIMDTIPSCRLQKTIHFKYIILHSGHHGASYQICQDIHKSQIDALNSVW